ncbi:MAG: tripartite tricarboxylate transporter substrate binding protein [Variovorax sp.]|nr:tripartite tricarboxylate transporter substrate binding protein [Variovorax sp.]
MTTLPRLLRVLFAVLPLAAALPAQADYPDKPLKLVVPYAPGGITDNLARALADGIGRELKQPVVVENKVGAGAIVGTGAAARSPADGYTLLMASNGNLVVTPLITRKLNYDTERDLRVIAVVGEVPTVLVANTSLPVTDMKSLGEYGRANAGKLNYASLGQGNVLYLTMRKIEDDLKIRMTEVPYKGSVPALTALMGNDVQLYVDVLPGALPFIQAGKLRALGVPMDQRIEWLPDVPTLREQGLPAFHAASWLGIAVPTGTPPEAIAALQGAIKRHTQEPEFRRTFTKAGMLLLPPMDGPQVDAYLKADRERWGALVRQHNISVD